MSHKNIPSVPTRHNVVCDIAALFLHHVDCEVRLTSPIAPKSLLEAPKAFLVCPLYIMVCEEIQNIH